MVAQDLWHLCSFKQLLEVFDKIDHFLVMNIDRLKFIQNAVSSNSEFFYFFVTLVFGVANGSD
jgi:hypothetical protein